MTCNLCHTVCGTVNPPIPPQGEGHVLIILSELFSKQDFASRYHTSEYRRALDILYAGAGLSAEDCTIISVAGCRGGGTSPYLTSALANRRHRTIIAFGDEALRYLCKKSGVRDKRGQAYPLHKSFGIEASIWSTYGLGDVLNNPNYYKVVIQDIRKALGNNSEETKTEWKRWEGEPLSGDTIAWDIETLDDKGGYTDYPTLVSCAGDGFCYVSYNTEESVRGLLVALRNYEGTHVTHNGYVFDVPMTRKFGIDMPWGEDTMALAFLEDETQSKGLESLCVKHLKVPGWKEGGLQNAINSDEIALYAARDAGYTLRLYRKLRDILGKRHKIATHVLYPAYQAFSATSERGLLLSPTTIARIRAEEEEKLKNATETLKTLAGPDFNPGSSKEVAQFLQGSGVTLPVTEAGNAQTSVGVLQDIGGDFCLAVLAYRRASKVLATYCKNYEDRLKEDGRVHSVYKLWSARTGRSTSSKMNVQNNMREHEDVFCAPPGGVFASIDYSAEEFRIAAWYAQEPTILANFQKDPAWDPHRYFASILYSKPEKDITKSERQIAKSGNFGLLFLGNAHTLVEYMGKMGIKVELQECQRIYKAWHTAFPGFAQWYKSVREELERTSEVATATGHVRHYGDFRALSYYKKVDALREAVNVKAQGLAAHIGFIAMARLHDLNIPVVNFVHDSISVEYNSKKEYERDLPKIIHALTVYPIEYMKEHFNVDFNIPLLCEAKVKQC
jgi:DNA polymerase I-like protein with 3'-5' exonuclease and polymerase domains/uracil-DNA glycosylase